LVLNAALRINMTGLCDDPAEDAKRYQAAIDMAVFAEERGFTAVNMEEHHCADNGWLPAPLTIAAMVIARTQKIRVSVAALLVTLYDPIRLAEDIAVLDLVSNGRFSFVAGLGYRPIEYHATGKKWEDRGRLMEECIDTLLKAWTGEPFDYKGQTLRVTPVPMTRPHPFFFVGGMSVVAAKRAARFSLPFYPPQDRPDLQTVYEAELERLGNKGFYYSPGKGNSMLVIEEDPESAWKELAPYFLRELSEYTSWKQEGVARPSEELVRNIDDLKKQKRFEILSPAQARERFSRGGDAMAVMHPLAGGVPVDRAWHQLRLFCDEVLLPLQREARG
jgi:alkanesulfonate monooxygenase SsuD/methylene tetrahydromethanopterin reductase-like flavin-dependent oxidoreductase (luciferase family)